ncbi:MAG: tetracycline resistance MFS efflux pump [Chlorobiaceae bacterium]|nr:tetracycline resistance MFS efflux pump [Chlorobiaceae bacterium]MBA4308786.1 tetracycline resistance MFS efflux pump [Chlorobiaceae bacterium]
MKKNIPLTLIFIVVFIDLLGFGLLIPILPTFASRELKVDETAVGIALALYSFFQFIFNPLLGALSDRIGRRKIILVTLLLNAIGYIIFAYTNTYFLLLLSRVVGGIGGSSIGVAQAYIADVTTKEDRSKGMGLIGVAFGLGFVFGPVLGGILSGFGYEVVGLVSAAFSLLACIFSYFFLPESLKEENRSQEKRKLFFSFSTVKIVFKNSSVAIVILLFFIITFSVANIYGTFPLLGYQAYGFSDLQIGYLFGIIGIAGAIVQGGLVGRLSKKFQDRILITFGAFFVMIGLGLLPYGGNFLGLAIIGIVLSLGTGILQPTILSLLSKVTKENEQGMVLGINQSFAAFARMLGPLWGGISFEYLGYEIPFLTGAFFTLIIFLFGIFYLAKYVPESTRR